MKNQQTHKKTIIYILCNKAKVEILIQINYKKPRKWIKREWLRQGQKKGVRAATTMGSKDNNRRKNNKENEESADS